MKAHSLFVTKSSTDSAAPQTEGVAVSSTNTYYSQLISGSRVCSIAVQWTGDPTGTLTLWGSNKNEPILSSDADWYQITDALTDPAGTASATHENFVDKNSKWKRLKYVNASGSGTLTGQVGVGEQG